MSEQQTEQQTNLPQLAVNYILAAIADGSVRYVEAKNVVIDHIPNTDWNGKSYIAVAEDISTGFPYQHGVGPVKTPLVIRAYSETRESAALLCKEATQAVLTGFTRLTRTGVGILGAYIDVTKTEGKKNALLHGGKRDENYAVRFLIVFNTLNS